MPLTNDDIDLLACPVCRVPVAFTADRTGLECPRCGRVYPIKDDIPQMMVEEARQPSEG